MLMFFNICKSNKLKIKHVSTVDHYWAVEMVSLGFFEADINTDTAYQYQLSLILLTIIYCKKEIHDMKRCEKSNTLLSDYFFAEVAS